MVQILNATFVSSSKSCKGITYLKDILPSNDDEDKEVSTLI